MSDAMVKNGLENSVSPMLCQAIAQSKAGS